MDLTRTLDVVRWALRRSRIRSAILLALLKIGQAHLSDLARMTGFEARRVRAAIYGDGETYRMMGGLAFLGLVRERASGGRVVIALTARGRRVALALRRDVVRDHRRRPRVRT